MNLGELLRRRAEGEAITVPDVLRQDYDAVVEGEEMIRAANPAEAASASPSAERPLPTLPLDYQIERELGYGGMGVVYLAFDASLQRKVAVKVLRPTECALDEVLRRFKAEARSLARLRHPNIVSIHDTGELDEPYFVMDYIDGESLEARLLRGRIAPLDAVRILTDVSAGVAYAQAQGIIHRDLKPGNILLDQEGKAYVSDFGLARDVRAKVSFTHPAAVMGTPAYMAPEQLDGQGDRVGPSSDVWALGVVLYEMLTGQRPFQARVEAELPAHILHDEVTRPGKIAPSIPFDLETICLKALQRDPGERYATVEDLLADLRRLAERKTIRARRPPLRIWLARRLRRHWTAISAVAAAVVVVTLGVRQASAHREDLSRQGRESAARLAVEGRAGAKAAALGLADRLHDQGDLAGAVRALRDAWDNAEPDERDGIVDRMARYCGEIDFGDHPLASWKLVLSLAPERSFGALDSVVARVLVADLEMRKDGLRVTAMRDSDDAAFVAKRLHLWLDGNDSHDKETNEARKKLVVIEDQQAPAPFQILGDGARHDVPCDGGGNPPAPGAADGKDSRWSEATTVMEDAQKMIRAGQKVGAVTLYQDAMKTMCDEFPVWCFSDTQASRSTNEERGPDGKVRDVPYWRVRRELGEGPCSQLNEAYAAIQRLAPATPKDLTGGIVFQLGGDDLPKHVALGLRVDLWRDPMKEPKPTSDRQSATPSLSIDPEKPKDRTMKVGVANGTWHMKVADAWRVPLDDDGDGEGALYELVWDKMPDSVTIDGKWLEPLVVRVHKLPEVALTAPAPGASVDLSKDVFRWVERKGVKYYLLKLRRHVEKDDAGNIQGGTPWEASVQVEKSGVSLADIEAGRVGGRIDGPKDGLVQGAKVDWVVEAYDEDKDHHPHLLATSGSGREMLLSHGLEKK